MPSPVENTSSARSYRADFYLFRHFLMGLGAFRDERVVSNEAMKLVFGINRPFRIRLEGEWVEARAALLSGGTPHFLNGDGDWQIVLWLERDSSLGILLDARVLEGRPWTVQGDIAELSMLDVIQTSGDFPDPPGALALAETLLAAYGGITPVPATWDNQIRSVINLIEANSGNETVQSLADSVSSPVADVEADFRRVVGAGLDDYLHRRKTALYVELRQNGEKRQDALRAAGLPGWEGMKERFASRYGLDLEVLDEQSPFVRVYRGREDQAVLYL